VEVDIKKMNDRIEFLKNQLTLESEIMKDFRKLEYERIEKDRERARVYKKLNRKREYIEKLKKFTINSIIKFITGKRKERLREEEIEYDEIKRKFEKVLDEISDIQNQKEVVYEKLREFKGFNKELRELLETKEKIIREVNPVISDKIDEINQEIENLEEGILKIHKAIGIGEEAIKDLKYTEDTLSDTEQEMEKELIFSGKGRSRVYRKYKKVENARAEIDSTNDTIERFKIAVNNHNFCSGIAIETDLFTEFRAFGLGGIFATLKVKDRISDSRYGLSQTRGIIEDMINLLYKDKENKYIKINLLKEERDDIIAMTN